MDKIPHVISYAEDTMKYIIKLNKTKDVNIISVINFIMIKASRLKLDGNKKKELVLLVVQYIEEFLDEDLFDDADISELIESLYKTYTSIYKIKSYCCN